LNVVPAVAVRLPESVPPDCTTIEGTDPVPAIKAPDPTEAKRYPWGKRLVGGIRTRDCFRREAF